MFVRESETVTADDRPGMDEDPVADPGVVVEGDVGHQPGTDPEDRVPAYETPRPHDHTGSEPHTGLHHAVRSDRGRRVHLRRRIHDGGGMDARRCRRRRIERLRHPRVGEVGVLDQQDIARVPLRIRRPQNDRPGVGGVQVGTVAGVGEKADLPGSGALQRRHAVDPGIRIPPQLAGKQLSELPQAQTAVLSHRQPQRALSRRCTTSSVISTRLLE